MKEYPEIRKEVADHVFGNIVPRYASFDPAHREDHAMTVISQAMELMDRMPEWLKRQPEDIAGQWNIPIDREALFVAAAYHDLGLAGGRERHHIDSGSIIRNDRTLRRWFNEEMTEIMAQAAEDHRASGKNAPRSIYGMLVAEADRVIEGSTIIRRTVQFGLTNHPGLGREEQICRAVEHLKEKYGRGGYMKLWIPWSDNAARLCALQDIIADAAAVRTATASEYDRLVRS